MTIIVIITMLIILATPMIVMADVIAPTDFTVEYMDSHPAEVTILEPSDDLVLSVVNKNPEVIRLTYSKNTKTYKFLYKESVDHLRGVLDYNLPDNAQKLLQSIDDKPDFFKINAIYTWIRNNCEYDRTFRDDPTATRQSDPANAIGVFNGSAVCSGYADAFYLLTNLAGVNCYITSNVKHAWNIVELDGMWYFVDATNGHFLVGTDCYGKMYNLTPCYYHGKKIEEDNYNG